MSWQSYVDDHLIGTGHVVQGAICGVDGAIWAVSAGFNVRPRASHGPVPSLFLVVEPRRAEIPYLPPPSSTQVSPEEVQKLVAAFEDPSGLQAGGIYLCGEKHMFIRSDDRFIAGKRVRCQFFFPRPARDPRTHHPPVPFSHIAG